MPVTKGPAKGSATPLKIAQEGARRFFVGLSWDPPGNVGQKIEVAKGPDNNFTSKLAHALFAPLEFVRVTFLASSNLVVQAAADAQRNKADDARGRDATSSAYDLDLDAYIYDANGAFLRVVGTEGAAYIDPSKKVYHTGDDQTGGGGVDDEQVFVETNGLPPEYAQFYFVVKCDSKFDFSHYANPKIRLADSKTGEVQLECSLSDAAKSGAGKFNYVFCRVTKQGDGWVFENIDTYVGEDMDWENGLTKLVA